MSKSIVFGGVFMELVATLLPIPGLSSLNDWKVCLLAGAATALIGVTSKGAAQVLELFRHETFQAT